ncbi:N-acetylglucosamine-6-phosphate deacetylase [Thiolinea disciformis]|uniref:N-acetylglucosamine-6-phosphate deacetylase n=1 Tax=Thiolinea disciformis TaxID=125614 RepID=UPI000380CC3A|nr:N-acetylglucosamine-6-phosphate deacetylase [Thiolinea disciformis]
MNSSTAPFALTHFDYFDGDQRIAGQALIIDQAKIVSILPERDLPSDLAKVDCQGQLLAAGFIDTQVNGGGGVMFNEYPTVEGIQTIVRAHWQGGTTSLLPTLITDSADVMQQAVHAVGEVVAGHNTGILGIHLEGPHLSVDRRGVHSPQFIRPFDATTEQLLHVLSPEHYLLTVAPENQPKGTIHQLAQRGIRVSAGHTTATYAQMRAAIEEGVTAVTHLYNAMTPLTSREPGVVGAALEDDTVYCGIIMDNHHLHPTTAKLAIAQKASGKMMLVTDAMATVGSLEKSFRLYNETIYEVDGRCAKSDGTLAGSALDMASAVRHCVHFGIPLPEALRMASLYPATFMGVAQRLGKIALGYQADLVLLNQDLHVQQTWCAGTLRYSA